MKLISASLFVALGLMIGSALSAATARTVPVPHAATGMEAPSTSSPHTEYALAGDVGAGLAASR